MSANGMTEAMQRLLHPGHDGEVAHCLAVGKLWERLVSAAGHKQENIGRITTALLLLWRGDHNNGVEQIEPARLRALEALRGAELNVNELTRLATCGRLLLGAALELQGEVLLAVADAEAAEYTPREGDLAVWLGKHVVKVVSVDVSEVHDGTGRIGTITNVVVHTAGGQRMPVSPKELTLYHRES